MLRRTFLLGMSALVAAPAVVRAASLMPVVPTRWEGQLSAQAYADELAKTLYDMVRTDKSLFSVTHSPIWDRPVLKPLHICAGQDMTEGLFRSYQERVDRQYKSTISGLACFSIMRYSECPPLIRDGIFFYGDGIQSDIIDVKEQAIGEYLGAKVRYVRANYPQDEGGSCMASLIHIGTKDIARAA